MGREFWRSRPASFQQRTNTSCHLAMPTRGFTAVVSVFGAHLLRSPQDVKFVLRVPAMRWAAHGQTTPVTLLSASSPNSGCRRMTSPGCRVALVHSPFAFRCRCSSFSSAGKNKKPCLHSVSRVEKFQMILYLPTMGPTKLIPGLCPKYKLERPRPNTPTGRDQP